MAAPRSWLRPWLLLMCVAVAAPPSSGLRSAPEAPSLERLRYEVAGLAKEDGGYPEERVRAAHSLRAAINALLAPERLQPALEQAAQALQLPNAPLPIPNACVMDIGQMVFAASRGDIQALQMLDSSSKLVTGVLYGSFADLGNFDECVDSVVNTFSGRFFLPAYDISTFNNDTKVWKKLLTLRSSFCLPSSCSADQVHTALRMSLQNLTNYMLSSSGIQLGIRLPDEFTAVNAPRRAPNTADIVVIVICVALLLTGLVASVVDYMAPAERRNGPLGYLLAFSMLSNGRSLFRATRSSPSSIGCLNGLRVLSISWVILGHRYKWALDAPFMNLAIMPKQVEDYSKMLIAGAPLAVDTFFTIGGLLVCFVTLRSLEKKPYFNVPHFYFHRYVRLTPVLALLMAIHATWFDLIGNGPMWFDNLMFYSAQCRQYWWSNLLYISNYYNPIDICMGHTWYLMVDMQLYVITPLMLIPLWRWPRLGLAWLILVTVASCAVPFAVSWVNHIRAHVPLDFDQEGFRKAMKLEYMPTHMRATAYFIGILAGYILYLERKGKIRVNLSPVHVGLGWLTSTFLCLTVVFGAQPILDATNHTYNQLESAMYIGFHRVAWGAGISWIILACSWGYGGIVDKFLSSYPFQVLSRLTYSVYLVHVLVQTYDFGTMRDPEFWSDFRMVHAAAGDAVISLVLGVLLTLLAESPILTLEKKLLGGGRRPRTEQLRESTLQPEDITGAAIKDKGLPA